MTEEQAAKARRMAESKQWTLEQIAVGLKLDKAIVKKWLADHGLTVKSSIAQACKTRASLVAN